MEGSPSRKRKQLTLNTKYEIIKACETESKTSVAKKFEVAPSTITGILLHTSDIKQKTIKDFFVRSETRD